MSQSGKNFRSEEEKFRKNVGNFRNTQNDKFVKLFLF